MRISPANRFQQLASGGREPPDKVIRGLTPPARWSRARSFHHAGPRDRGVGEGFFAPVMLIAQARVVDPQLMQQRGQQAGTTYAILDGLVAELIRRTVDVAGPEAAAGQQQREAMTVVVAP